MRKILTLLVVLFAVFFFSTFHVFAKNEFKVYLFYGDGCPHCKEEREFLDGLKNKFSNLEIKSFEVYNNRENALLMKNVGEAFGAQTSGVPFLVIGDKYIVGYAENITSTEIEEALNKCSENGCPDMVFEIISRSEKGKEISILKEIGDKQGSYDSSKDKQIKLPFLGDIQTSQLSLPMLTVVMGFLDGFNPCAMWALIFLISLLLGMEDRKKMWVLGSAFIVASSMVYFMFMAAWLNLILFIGLVFIVRVVIGIIALFGGVYSLKEFVTDKEGGCKVSSSPGRKKFFERSKNLVQKSGFWLALGGIIILAFMVNLVELICSAGLPAVYTQVLSMNDLSKFQYYVYILIYIFFFMIDDLIVFFVAMTTLRITGVTTKYSRFSRLAGGLAMVAIGLMLIFKPQLLMFG